MIFQGVDVSGSFDITGSFVTPKGAAFPLTASSVQGDMFFHTTNDQMYVFTTSGSWTPIGDITSSPPPPPAEVNIEYLVVAGGGGGSAGFGNGNGTGGGGAGGMLSSSLNSMASGSIITVTIGAGGSGGTSTTQAGSGATNRGADGTNSSIASTSGTSFSTVTCTGGGSGGRGSADQAGNDGGSGGGGGAYSGAGGSGTTGQGNDGGTGTPSGNSNYRGGGGGGKSAAGATGTASGNGGAGLASVITGTSTTYAGGGGGGCYAGKTPGSAGTGGGGAGSAGSSTPGSGTANTGGGGGGSGWPGSSTSTGASGGAGGAGVVILAYPTGSATGKGGIKTTRSDGQFVHTFNESGTFTLGGASFMTVAPGDHFNTVLYTGNRPNTQSITGVGFKPDFVWAKLRSASGYGAVLANSVSGAQKFLDSSNDSTEVSATNSLTSFDTDGFSVGGYGNWNGGLSGANGTMVAWCWKAGGTAVSNTDGSITSTVSANQAAGFSIVKYTAGSSTNFTQAVGHGLSQAPQMIIQKRTDSSSSNWYVIFTALDGSIDYMNLNTDSAKTDMETADSGAYVNFTIGNTGFSDWWGGSYNIINYCFHDIAGYQKIGTYTGTGSSNTINVGFKPKFLLIKGNLDSTNWVIVDNQRDNADEWLYANTTDGTYDDGLTYTAFTANGFTVDTTGTYVNSSGVNYIYLAISE